MDAMSRKQKNQDAVLSTDVAKQMLSNIFEACEQEENRVPIDVLESYSHYRKERYGLQRFVVILVIIGFALLPLLFVTPAVATAWEPDAQAGAPVLRMTADSFLPVDSIKATMDGIELSVYQEADETYLIYPSRNGVLEILVTLVNRQYTRVQVEVTAVDNTPPELVESHLQDGDLKIYFWDDSGTLDYASIYAMDTAGNTVMPLSWDETEMSVLFAYPDTDLNIFVSDLCENTLQLVLSVD